MRSFLKEPSLRSWHRKMGIVLAPLVVLQVISGLVIAFEVLFGLHHDVSGFLNEREAHGLHRFWDYIGIDIHYGGGSLGTIYHIALGIGLLWLVVSGSVLYVKVRRRMRGLEGLRRPAP